ncbi:MAG TPA: nuclear transport factor 2 family protein [Candidatus Binataceae bacterium]|nr:nuclear transport factor 2 family protein [Candidatus Binataceae bacterium]
MKSIAPSPKTTNVPFYKLVASSVDLASVFKIAVDAFNARDLTTLMNLCDDNIVVVGVKRQDPYCGKSAVAAYFAEQFRTNKPTFTPTTSATTINSTASVGHIIGAADWTDRDPDDPQGAPLDSTVRYAFNFVSRGNGWLISTLWGSTDQ